MTDFDRTSIKEFSKELKKLKVRHIEKDLAVFEKAFEQDKERLTGLVQIPELEKKGVTIPIYKATKFRCKSMNMGSRSGIRLIFAYSVEEDKVTYIETYKKNNKENNDENRILKYFQN